MALPVDLLIVSSEIESSVEDDWNHWYDTVHLPEIASCPGIRSAQRYVAKDVGGSRHYVAIYALEGPEAIESLEFSQRRGWGPYGDKVTFQTRLFKRIRMIA